ncbi:hypothetical protein [Streptomyces malaysiensis]|uniref:hypothetical protein n=1 Tax=Streptomyces malaysiensis TaxID=92644 RepID=UPI003720D4C2
MGATATACGLDAAGSASAVAATSAAGAAASAKRHRTRIVMLGTAGGPMLGGNDCVGISTATLYGTNDVGEPVRHFNHVLRGLESLPVTVVTG